MKIKLIVVIALVALLTNCSGEKPKTEIEKKAPTKTEVKKEVKTEVVTGDYMNDKGVGPITSLELGELDTALAGKGKGIYKAKCTACHKISKRFVGPGLKGVTQRRSPEWIMNMILDPERMVVENEAAKQLLMEYNAPMANQNLTEDEARAILEYFRTKN